MRKIMTQKLRMLPLNYYPKSEIDDPLPLYYLPLFSNLYRGRVELCLNALKPGRRVLEVGYGSGTSFLNLARMYQEIYGIDLHRHASLVQDTFFRIGIETQLCTASLLHLPYPDCFFDTVLCISILEHLQVDQQPLAMDEIRRVLKPSGQFVYGVPVERPLMQAGFRLLGYDIRKYHFSTERDVAAAADARFRRVSIQRYQPFGALIGSLYEVGVYERP
jgi:ubiquinone/menaquinone biosynthesis C-methylase UbiE